MTGFPNYPIASCSHLWITLDNQIIIIVCLLISTRYKQNLKNSNEPTVVKMVRVQKVLKPTSSPFGTSSLESLPSAVAIWTPDRDACILNIQARKLLGFTEENFRKFPSIWINRIHPEDRNQVSKIWKRLVAGEKNISCDYRFFPRKNKKWIWLRDVSACCESHHGEIQLITSTYTDISDLKRRHPNKPKEPGTPDVIQIVGGLVHEMTNNIQVLNLGFDLMQQGEVSPSAYQEIANSVQRTDKSVRELREYLLPPNTHFSKENPGIVLEDVVREMGKELARHGVQTRLVQPNSLPLVRLDLDQFRNVLTRVMQFSRALLPKGGTMEIRAGQRRIRGQRHVELKIASSSTTPLGVEEKDVFRPFLRVNGYQVGLSIELAQQILRRHNGKIFFQKQNPRRGQFTILLKVSSH